MRETLREKERNTLRENYIETDIEREILRRVVINPTQVLWVCRFIKFI